MRAGSGGGGGGGAGPIAASATTKIRAQRPKMINTRRQRLRDAILRICYLRSVSCAHTPTRSRTMEFSSASAEQDAVAEIQSRSAWQRRRARFHVLAVGARDANRPRGQCARRCGTAHHANNTPHCLLRRGGCGQRRDDGDSRRGGHRLRRGRDSCAAERDDGEQQAQAALEPSRHRDTMRTPGSRRNAAFAPGCELGPLAHRGQLSMRSAGR
jgi:hypothetical protein